MESVEVLIPDNEGNHLVVVLSFYDDITKDAAFEIPDEFSDIDIADISINKLNPDRPINIRALIRMCDWLIEEMQLFPNAVFSFVCSLQPLTTNHPDIEAAEYRWRLFEALYKRNHTRLQYLKIESKDIIVGPDGYKTYAKVFYRQAHAPIIHVVISHLTDKS